MNTYEVRFNKSTYTAESIEEAESIALDLVEASCPFIARIIEIGEDGEFVRTVKTLDAAAAQ